jgi:hypothetical protein
MYDNSTEARHGSNGNKHGTIAANDSGKGIADEKSIML